MPQLRLTKRTAFAELRFQQYEALSQKITDLTAQIAALPLTAADEYTVLIAQKQSLQVRKDAMREDIKGELREAQTRLNTYPKDTKEHWEGMLKGETTPPVIRGLDRQITELEASLGTIGSPGLVADLAAAETRIGQAQTQLTDLQAVQAVFELRGQPGNDPETGALPTMPAGVLSGGEQRAYQDYIQAQNALGALKVAAHGKVVGSVEQIAYTQAQEEFRGRNRQMSAVLKTHTAQRTRDLAGLKNNAAETQQDLDETKAQIAALKQQQQTYKEAIKATDKLDKGKGPLKYVLYFIALLFLSLSIGLGAAVATTPIGALVMALISFSAFVLQKGREGSEFASKNKWVYPIGIGLSIIAGFVAAAILPAVAVLVAFATMATVVFGYALYSMAKFALEKMQPYMPVIKRALAIMIGLAAILTGAIVFGPASTYALGAGLLSATGIGVGLGLLAMAITIVVLVVSAHSDQKKLDAAASQAASQPGAQMTSPSTGGLSTSGLLNTALGMAPTPSAALAASSSSPSTPLLASGNTASTGSGIQSWQQQGQQSQAVQADFGTLLDKLEEDAEEPQNRLLGG